MGRRRRSSSGAAAFLVGILALEACGKRGDPLAPLPRTPQVVTELKVSQRGDKLVVTYVTPRMTTGGQRLPVLDVELQRADGAGDFAKLARKSRSKAAPGESIVTQEALPAPGTQVRLAVRALSGGQPSNLTPIVAFTTRPPVPAPAELQARLGPDAVALAWKPPVLPPPSPAPSPPPVAVSAPSASPTPAAASPTPALSSPSPPAGAPSPSPSPSPSPAAGPTPSPSPSPSPPPPGFWVYRREKAGGYGPPLGAQPKPEASYEDLTAQPGQNLCYVVRTVVSTEPVVESGDSNESCVEVRDIKPPPAPSGLTAIARDGAVELSWSPLSGSDAVKIRIYRSEAGGERERLAEVAAGETSFRDPSGTAGQSYTLTAVDAAGNESDPSPRAEATTP